MTTLHDAARLISGLRRTRDLAELLARLQFLEWAPLDVADRARLGIAPEITRAQVATGPGTLRALVVDVGPGASLREAVARTAARISARAPQMLWLLAAVEPASHTLAVAAPPPGATGAVVALLVDTRRVMDSDAETVAAMIAAAGSADVLVHHRWREILGRDALTRRFYRELEAVVSDMASTAVGGAPDAARREIALLHASRILFLAFLEARGWLDGDRGFLRRSFDACCASGGGVQRRILDPLFFGTLNTPVAQRAPRARMLGRIPFLNGGLFARSGIEKRHRALVIPDEALGRLISGLLGHYRVTAREESASWSEAAVDPEMLGRAFESLMASSDRREGGVFYTPRPLIEHLTDEALRALLPSEPDCKETRRILATVRIIDPSCGSGAFLVHLLERLSALLRSSGDPRPLDEVRRAVLAMSIFGVDVNPTAVWLCQLRLWLSIVVDADERDPLLVAPLPNLDRHVRVGDALDGPSFDDGPQGADALASLRVRYARSTGARKRTLARALDREERIAAIALARLEVQRIRERRCDLLSALRGRDLFAARMVATPAQRAELHDLRRSARSARRRLSGLRAGGALPFSFPAHYADAAAAGGFDLVIGNPPWVRLHRIPPAARLALSRRYRAFREAAWLDGASGSAAGRGFAAQVDLAALFTERSLQLARPGGTAALLLPSKLWRSLAGGGVRREVQERSEPCILEDWSESRSAFDAVVYPSILVTRRRATRDAPSHRILRAAIHRRDDALDWEMPSTALPLDASPGAPWLLLPREVRAGFDRLAAAGVPLASSPLGRPLLGVKSGCNEAFIVTPRPGWRDSNERSWPVRADRREDVVERAMLRPLLRGEDVRAWGAVPGDEAVLWTHDRAGQPLATLPTRAALWLAPWRSRLVSRSDARTTQRWWSLYRTEAAQHDRARVVWSDISRRPRALVLVADDPTVPLNSCYVLRAASMDDALAFSALLNSAVSAAWLTALAEPARGGYHRFLGWTMSRLPIPADWPRAVGILAPLARAALDGHPPDEPALTAAALRAYRVRPPDIAPLLTWCLR